MRGKYMIARGQDTILGCCNKRNCARPWRTLPCWLLAVPSDLLLRLSYDDGKTHTTERSGCRFFLKAATNMSELRSRLLEG